MVMTIYKIKAFANVENLCAKQETLNTEIYYIFLLNRRTFLIQKQKKNLVVNKHGLFL